MYNIRKSKTIEFFRFNEIIYIDIIGIAGQETYFTLDKLSKILNFIPQIQIIKYLSAIIFTIDR
ncbi:hypothetical protein A0V28_08180 [Campylobacter jejuni]|nr:hypothetical protein [Campylobacter coli]EAL2730241.1 hypothetical protein [Campylobacter jejuni]EAH4469064.1 hypothetical protein [Campylobacter coli]EAH4484831.1 hypothetical protein [Campylobacter coli]EAH4486646.1 hypothetical protein [Campylobacter coli]